MRSQIILTLSALVLIAGCSEPTPEEKAKTYFLAGCLQGGTKKAVCECSYSKLSQKYPAEFFLIEEPELMDRRIIESFTMDVIKSAQLCLAENK